MTTLPNPFTEKPKGKYIWVFHGPNGEAIQFYGSKNAPEKAGKKFIASMKNADQWTVESWRAQ